MTPGGCKIQGERGTPPCDLSATKRARSPGFEHRAGPRRDPDGAFPPPRATL